MKEEKNNLHYNHPKKAKVVGFRLVRPIAIFSLLFLTFSLGYFSSNSFSTQPSYSSDPLVQDAANFPEYFRVTSKCGDPIPSDAVRQTILDGVFNSISPYDNFPPPYVGNRLRPVKIRGWGSRGAVFENLIRKVRPRTIIEVGSFLGASAIHMAQLTRQLGLETQIICVDDFRGWPGFLDSFKDIGMVNGDVLLLQQFMQNVVYHNATESILPVPFTSGAVLEKLCEWGIFGDLIEVDAGHDFHSAWVDIIRAHRILRPGGVLFGHDYFNKADNYGVRRAVILFARVHGLKIRADGQHWVIDSS
ncbi:uncharacterized protein LOC107407666 [Ziziphus jujuba]|nr:uncharacterized protein LOC107407666 [Ziziphus jujuba]